MTRSLSLMMRLHFTEPVVNTASILDTNDMEIGTASNVFS
ncbi:IS240-type transposase (ISH102) [Halorubrum sp. AJ67]|nr:IS240-type transposase (ISH102) [Halorubrum sp. AJ67]